MISLNFAPWAIATVPGVFECTEHTKTPSAPSIVRSNSGTAKTSLLLLLVGEDARVHFARKTTNKPTLPPAIIYLTGPSVCVCVYR